MASAARHGGASALSAARRLGGLLVPAVFVAAGVGSRLEPPGTDRSWVASALLVVAVLELAAVPHRAVLDGLVERRWSGLYRFAGSYVALSVARAAVAMAVAVGALALVRATGWWPLLLWGLVVATGLLWAAFHPTVVAPLVERTSALTDRPVEDRIARLAARAGLGAVPVDVRRLSTGEGAHLVGIGRRRRLVLDRAVAEGPLSDVEVVVAHELGHWRLGHARASLAAGAAAAALALGSVWLVGRLAGVDLGRPASLPLGLLTLGVAGEAAGTVSAAWSRRQEAQADRFGAGLVGSAAVADHLRRHYVASGADLDPGRWRRWTAGHAAPAERLAALSTPVEVGEGPIPPAPGRRGERPEFTPRSPPDPS